MQSGSSGMSIDHYRRYRQSRSVQQEDGQRGDINQQPALYARQCPALAGWLLQISSIARPVQLHS